MADVAQSPVPLDTIPISPEGGDAASDSAPTTSSGDVVTVFHDPENFNVKHPLAHTWTLWFTKPPSGKQQDWNELLKEVISFNSVEEFWGIYNNITPSSELAPKSDYHLFKQGVRPEWEDPQNKHGGRWSYTFKQRQANDDIWLHVLLAAIGEQLEDDNDNEVMGVVINIRKAFYRVGLWTRSAGTKANPAKQGQPQRTPQESQAILMKIGQRFKAVLTVQDKEVIEFMGHSDSANAGSTRAKAKYSA
ncbi:eukaryotic translation initiation factor 4E [Aureobasidium subglaciale]|nr:eukaryotic translation initiation factor 4E [Aureobasidium subglaciale]KAI5221252.1 eukaryotic translation initiation factor 4E [Aureobasidium subglaciale]KAI5225210.1 eukaryotic translation initiation factor 4E [Aureobasidium subglaciale]KAI5261371.1 eukaryotic translation initiation factor 4E [Aureobasidium subglaciale]